MRSIASLTACLSAALILAVPGHAHKGITSKFTYNGEVFPVFLARCSGCHRDGGVGPMSLLKYQDAFPWAEALRTELLAAASATDAAHTGDDPAGRDFVRAAHRQISAKELDIVLDWATGGTPEGDASNTPPPPGPMAREWAGAAPDLVVAMEHPFELPANAVEKTEEFELSVPVTQPRSAYELDVRPGNPAIVRTVAIFLRTRDGENRPLGIWFPRQTPQPLALKPAARLEPGTRIVARIHYKKNWKLEGEAVTDQSAVGFYFGE